MKAYGKTIIALASIIFVTGMTFSQCAPDRPNTTAAPTTATPTTAAPAETAPNDKRQFDTENAIKLIERTDLFGSLEEHTCYLLKDGHIFADRETGISNRFEPFMITVFADFKMLSSDTYSFEKLVEYLE